MRLLIKTTTQGLEIEIPDDELKAILREVWSRREFNHVTKEAPNAGAKIESEILTVKEAAQLLNLKEGTLYLWASQRRLPSVKIGRHRRFVKSELMEWFEKHKNGVSQPPDL